MASGLSITSVPWGTVNGEAVELFTLRGSDGAMRVEIATYGGLVQSIWVPDRSGELRNVALGFPSLSDYVNCSTQAATGVPWPLPGGSGNPYFGAIVGRYCNRIAGASFSLGGTSYALDANNGANTLHGGLLGWNTYVWDATTAAGEEFVALRLTHLNPEGEGCAAPPTAGCTGFPAPVMATVTYRLTGEHELKIEYVATNQSSSLATVINLTNHTYFNLAGEGSGDVFGQLLAIGADRYIPVDVDAIPQPPYFLPVADTAYDFRAIKPIGREIRAAAVPDGTAGPLGQLQIAHGYDNTWVLASYGTYRLVAVAHDPSGGITLWTYTDQPGVQMYTGNFLAGELIGTGGSAYRQGDGFALETQHYPDSPHHIGEPGWPSVVLDPGATFSSTTSYRFSVEGPEITERVRFS